MATIKEVARRAGVSVGTVSNVLSGDVTVSRELRERVERAIGELDYHPNHIARSLKSRRTKTLGVVISDITNPFFPLAVRGVEAAALQRGYLLTIFNTDDQVEREQQVFSLLRMRGVDGVLAVVAPNPGGKMEHLQELVKREIPLVCLDRVPKRLRVDAVVVDNLKGAAICVRHLISMGHQRIGVISGPADLQTARDRLKGYRLALREAGIAFDPLLVREGDFRMDSGYRLAKDLLLIHSRPTALFAANGMMGLGTLKAVQEMALRCPDDVALAIFDDVPGADVFRPRLTAVAQPAYELGYKAAELLIRRVTGEIHSKEPVVVTLEPELKVRESTVADPRSIPRNV